MFQLPLSMEKYRPLVQLMGLAMDHCRYTVVHGPAYKSRSPQDIKGVSLMLSGAARHNAARAVGRGRASRALKAFWGDFPVKKITNHKSGRQRYKLCHFSGCFITVHLSSNHYSLRLRGLSRSDTCISVLRHVALGMSQITVARISFKLHYCVDIMKYDSNPH